MKNLKVNIFTESQLLQDDILLAAYFGNDDRSINLSKDCGSVADLFASDPDYIQVNGFKVPFECFEHEDENYIIVPDPAIEKGYSEETDAIDSDKLMLMLNRFPTENFKDFYSHDSDNNTWNAFDNMANGIAYRGGSGYVYTIWQYNA